MKRIITIAAKDIAISITCMPFFFAVTNDVIQSIWCGLIVFLETTLQFRIVDYQLMKKERGIKRRTIIAVEYIYLSIFCTAFFCLVTNNVDRSMWCGLIVLLVSIFEGCIIDHQLMKKGKANYGE